MKISAIILTKNEEKNIEKCLESLSWCDEIIIVDDYSEDNTSLVISRQSLVVRNKIKIFKRHLDGDFAAQRNFGLEKASGNWDLFVDADEVISEELEAEIKQKVLSHSGEERSDDTRIRFWASQNDVKKVNGYYIKRQDYFLGRWLKHGETGQAKFLRLAVKGAGRWKGKVHEVWEVDGKADELTNPILHYPHQTVSEFLRDINWYTDLVAQYWKEQGRKMGFWEIVIYPLGKFIQNYIFRLGFLDGTAGFVLAALMSFHSFLARSKYWLKSSQ